MSKLPRFALLLMLLAPAVGCETKEDPRERPDFVDTTDPTKIEMPDAATPATP